VVPGLRLEGERVGLGGLLWTFRLFGFFLCFLGGSAPGVYVAGLHPISFLLGFLVHPSNKSSLSLCIVRHHVVVRTIHYARFLPLLPSALIDGLLKLRSGILHTHIKTQLTTLIRQTQPTSKATANFSIH